MKHPHSALLSVFLGLAAVGIAQGAVVLSNTGQTPLDVDTASGNHWLAAPFQTGSNPSGYSLSSVSVSIRGAGASIANGGFAISVWNNNFGVPGSVISGGSLSGEANPTPPATSLFTYTASAATLAPSTLYWVVASVSPGSLYQWNFAGSLTQDVIAPGWSINGQFAYRTDNIWAAQDSLESPFMLSISASPVPEPAEYAAVSALGLVGAAWLRRRRASR